MPLVSVINVNYVLIYLTFVLIYAELSSDNIEAVSQLPRERCTDVCGLEPLGLGQCVKGKSLPRLASATNNAGQRFVQVLNVGDHWICVTNRFSSDIATVYVYDSSTSEATPSRLAVLQTTSLLRRQDSSNDKITFCIRDFQQQTDGTRLCGYYAVAAAVSVCCNVDPTGATYDEKMLMSDE